MAEALVSSSQKSTNGRSYYREMKAVRIGFACLESISGAGAERVAGYLFAKPKRVAIRPEAEAIMAAGHRFELEAGCHTLAAWSWGDGPTVLLHHGWSGRASQMAPFVKPLVDAGFSVVAYDAPGHGDSPGTTTSLPEIARTLREAAFRLGGLHAVVGHSFGSAATLLAVRHGLRVDRAVLLSPPSDMNHFLDQFTETVGLSAGVRAGMERRWIDRYRFSWEDLDVRGWARGGRPPLLGFHDRDDRVVPWRQGAQVVRAWQDARLITTTGLGHRRIRENPEVVQEAVRFLRSPLRDGFPGSVRDAVDVAARPDEQFAVDQRRGRVDPFVERVAREDLEGVAVLEDQRGTVAAEDVHPPGGRDG